MAACRVYPYSFETLLGLCASLAGARPEDVRSKFHSTYFQDYFHAIGAQTIIVEEEYVDRDYLEDYAGFYALCFRAPRSHCARLHFFRTAFTQRALSRFLGGSSNPKTFRNKYLANKDYLGFVVIRPLPRTWIGRSCLRSYPDGDTGRMFPCLRDYEVHLFGISLTVTSLGFQEQDTEVARCATAALWSSLQATAVRFKHAVPTPLEITRNALAGHASRSRTLPAKDGLTIEQLADAVRSVHLEPYCLFAEEREILQSAAYAYLRAGIPALLTLALVATMDDDGAPRAIATLHDRHAVALTGFHFADDAPTPYGDTQLLLRASRIDKFYAHDDQVGPFARMALPSRGATQKWRGNERDGKVLESPFLECSWRNKSGKDGSIRAIPEHLVIPLYPKMRITYKDILDATATFDAVITQIASQHGIALRDRLEWDVFLTSVSDLKADLAGCEALSAQNRRNLMTASLPRFIWRAIGRQGTSPLIELLFDATDMVQGTFFLRAVEYVPDLLHILRHNNVPKLFAKSWACRDILEWFVAH